MRRVPVIVTGLLLIAARGFADERVDREDFGSSSLARGVRVNVGDHVFDFPRVARTSRPAAIAYSASLEGKSRVIFSVGWGVLWKNNVMVNAGGDPGERVVFLDPDTGAWQATSYHQPRPDVLTTSPDGRFVAMASKFGWTTEDVDSVKVSYNESRTNLNVDEVNDRLKAITCGTLRYSVWESASAQPVWEMRCYSRTAEAGQRAKFVRPWGQYARVALPWWAINTRPNIQFAQIGFSPDSKVFAALDPDHGVHLLNLVSGAQTHCCKPEGGRLPSWFGFVQGGSRIAVICDDGSVRLFATDTGAEQKEHQYRLPVGATVRDRDANFVIEPKSGQIGVSENGEFFLTSFGIANSDVTRIQVRGVGRAFGAGQIDTIALDRFVGIGFGREIAKVIIPQRTGLYEVVDPVKGRVIRRLVYRGTVDHLPKDDIPTIEISEKNEVRACLGPGGEIIYVQELP